MKTLVLVLGVVLTGFVVLKVSQPVSAAPDPPCKHARKINWDCSWEEVERDCSTNSKCEATKNGKIQAHYNLGFCYKKVHLWKRMQCENNGVGEASSTCTWKSTELSHKTFNHTCPANKCTSSTPVPVYNGNWFTNPGAKCQ